MARGFTTADNKFLDDFIYQPDWDMAKEALDKQDSIAQDSIDSLDLIESLKIDAAKFDEDNVLGIKQDITSKVDQVTNLLQKDATSREARMALKNLQREISDRYATGDISFIEKSAKNLRDFNAELEDSVAKGTRTQADAERYREGYLNNFLQENPNGSIGRNYERGTLMQGLDTLKDFESWWKSVGSESFETVKSSLKGKNWWEATDSEVNKIVGDKFKEFVESNPQYKSVMEHRQNTGFFNERYFNEDGSLDWNSSLSTLRPMNTTAQQLTDTKKVDRDRMVGMDEEAKMRLANQFDIDKENRAAARVASGSGDDEAYDMIGNMLDATGLSNVGAHMVKEENKAFDSILAFAGRNGIPMSKDSLNKLGIKTFTELHNHIINSDKFGANFKNAVAQSQKNLLDMQKATYTSVANKFPNLSESTYNNFLKNSKEVFNLNKDNFEYKIMGYNVKTTVDGKEKVTRYSHKSDKGYSRPGDLIGQTITAPNGEKVPILGATIKDNSHVPVITNVVEKVNSRGQKYLDLSNNDGVALMEVTYFDKNAIKTVDGVPVETGGVDSYGNPTYEKGALNTFTIQVTHDMSKTMAPTH